MLRRAPLWARVLVVGATFLAVWGAINWTYQAMRKPAELFFPVSGALAKTPEETWDAYGPLFEAHATAVITPPLLAALAQVEGAGNPVARTYWRWSFATNPFEVYRPASSAVGMYQITDATFAEAKHYCVHDHAVVEDGPWDDPSSCWFNILYTRVVPSHAIEMTSAWLDRSVATILARHRPDAVAARRPPNPERLEDLAAVVHLCGPAAGDGFAARGFRPLPGQRCGDQDVAGYLARVGSLKRLFARMPARY